MPNSHTLTVKNLFKDFIGLRAVDDLSLTLQQGEIVGLIGPNGSGKSTSINVITGLLKPSAGHVFVDNTEITGWAPHKIAGMGLARTFQTIKLFPDLTVLENVEVGAVSAGMLRRRAKQQAHTVLQVLDIDHLAALPAGTLPYGDERRVEIARALARTPQFLLLDEPAGGLNEQESDELLETLRGVPAKWGCAILIVDHDMRLIMRLCDRLHILNYGKTIGVGTPEEVRQNPAVIEAYLGSSANGGDNAAA
jgi:branched-chain amino acid transport system ATP-binding protein